MGRRKSRCAGHLALLGGAGLLVGASSAAAARTVLPSIPGNPTYACVGSPLKLFDNSNGQGVLNGGKPPTFSTRGKAYCLASITTYHWNTGTGMVPGTIGLNVIAGMGGRGVTLGPLPAVGSAGSNGAPNVNWTATAAVPIVISGLYSCVDSSPATWSANRASRGKGFCTVMARRAVKTPAPRAAKPTYACMGSQMTLYDNSNGFGVQNGGKPAAWNTYTQTLGISTYCLNSITTYHWNNGLGAQPGTLGLGPLNFQSALIMNPVPSRQAKGSSGQGGAPNVNWYRNFPASPPVVIGGAYYCRDSSPVSWSVNQESGGFGFCTVIGTPAYVTGYTVPGGPRFTATPPPSGGTSSAPPKPQGRIRCFTGTLSSMLLYPIHVPAGTSGLVLLHCNIKKSDGFQGSLAPSSVFVIHFGCTAFWTYPSQSGGPVTPYLQYTGAPNGTCSTAKIPVPWQVSGPWRIDYQTTNALTGSPLVPGSYVVFVESRRGDSSTENNLTVQ